MLFVDTGNSEKQKITQTSPAVLRLYDPPQHNKQTKRQKHKKCPHFPVHSALLSVFMKL